MKECFRVSTLKEGLRDLLSTRFWDIYMKNYEALWTVVQHKHTLFIVELCIFFFFLTTGAY